MNLTKHETVVHLRDVDLNKSINPWIVDYLIKQGYVDNVKDPRHGERGTSWKYFLTPKGRALVNEHKTIK